MKRTLKIAAVSSIMLLTTACAMGRSPVNNGAIFTDVKGSESVGVSASGSKRGESCATNVLGLVAYGDASARTAASNAGISKIQTVDYKTNTVLGVWARSCTQVAGE
jgi:hypothetical protein